MNGDRGSTLVGTSAGFLVFMLLLLGGVQILYDLYATSMVTGAARDAVSSVAGFDAGPDRCRAAALATASFEEVLGGYVRDAGLRLDWTCDDTEVVRLRITAQHPTALPRFLGDTTGIGSLGAFDRTVDVRVEAPR